MNGRVWPWSLVGPCAQSTRPRGGRCCRPPHRRLELGCQWGIVQGSWGKEPARGQPAPPPYWKPTGATGFKGKASPLPPPHTTVQPPLCLARLHGSSPADLGSHSG